MSRWTDKPHVLDVRHERVVLSSQTKLGRTIVADYPYKDSSLITAVQSCIEKLPKGNAKIEVTIDDSYARFWQVTPPLHASHFSDLQVSAAVRFETLFGLPIDEWVIEAEWNAKKSFWACALPLALINSIKNELGSNSRRIKLAGIYPYFIRQWNQHVNDCVHHAAGLAVISEQKMTVALTNDSSVKSIRTFPFNTLDPEAFHTADQHIQSLCLQLGITSPKKMLLASQSDAFIRDTSSKNIYWHRLKVSDATSKSRLKILKRSA